MILLGHGEDDSASAECLIKEKRVINLVGKLQIGEQHIIQNSACFVGNDSGLSYVAAATRVPTFVPFGPTDPILAAPLGDMFFL